ncbi:2-amino-4-hydroxy-6-hydroxymethyldihydropteridine diphosphokinase [Rhizobium sp. TH2]|uniref:2-amino-4-hydroxy-6- hydroxymethyldihydropteridine diphosphokinase n=1 Tax=Rhizobium sp. TH2 TaxID=2775403 RepID=UPI002157CDEC|nr:2-amino-4-hydroxy-6-hydroxymethyldihydropteridine diphosphokinase [Rhizobium sp. TH2]UVC10906.1 2-amino-4-hydroxy-6-hydroxymethyldihydropteridine diphosphokinase [Rhizobium sp. TH2]
MQDNNRISTALLGLGGNIGDPVAAMSSALQMLEQHPDCRVTQVSRLYKTPPWGKTDQEWFFNAAAEVETTLSPVPLLGLALGIEQVNRRVRAERWGPRTLDIDILDFGGLAIKSDQLTTPHPRMTERAFVLMPLADFAPDFTVNGKTVREWLAEVDASGIEVADESRHWWKATK